MSAGNGTGNGKAHDVAWVECVTPTSWTLHYRMFIEWGGKITVCRGSLTGFDSSEAAFEWLFRTLDGVTVVSRLDFLAGQSIAA